MSKALFRYLRGELNGFYLTRIHDVMNTVDSPIRSFLSSFRNMQFTLEDMDWATMVNLGKCASIFLPRQPLAQSKTALYMTDSHEVDGVEYSERGLYNTAGETFNFVHTEAEPSDDINTLATSADRSSQIGDEAVVGYIDGNAKDVLDGNGDVRPSKVLSTPPSSGAYGNYYGDQFLFLSEGDVEYSGLDPVLFYSLFKAVQWTRYNGAVMYSLMGIVQSLCPDGLVLIGEVAVAEDFKHLNVHYSYDSTVDVDFKEQRIYLLQYLINMKFKQVVLVED